MARVSKSQVFSLSELQKDIKFLRLSGFPLVKSAHPSDWPGDLDARVYYIFHNNKWQRVYITVLHKLLCNVLEKTAVTPKALTINNKKQIKVEGESLLADIIRNHVPVLGKLDDFFPDSAFIFFSEVTCIVREDSFICSAPNSNYNNRCSIVFPELTEISPNLFDESAFFKSETGAWLNNFAGFDPNFLGYIQEIFGTCLTPSVIWPRAHLVLDPNMGENPDIFRVLEFMVDEVERISFFGIKYDYYFGRVDEVLVNLSLQNHQDYTKAIAERIIDVIYPTICCEPKDMWFTDTEQDNFIGYPVCKHFFAIKKYPFFVLSERLKKVFKVLPANQSSNIKPFELPGILTAQNERLGLILWAIKGLQRLMRNKKFSECTVVEGATQKYFEFLTKANLEMDAMLEEKRLDDLKAKEEKKLFLRNLRQENKKKALQDKNR
jgi:hypothetical protein